MKKLLALLLVLSMAFALYGCGGQSTETAGTAAEPAEPAEPAGAAEAAEPAEEEKATDDIVFDFGRLQIKDITFCNKAELFLNVITWTSSSGSSTETIHPYFYAAKEDCILFAIKGTLTNEGQTDVTYDAMKGSVRFGEEEISLMLYPYEKSSEDSFKTLFAGTSAEVTACAQVPMIQFAQESTFTLKLGNTERVLTVADIPVVESVNETEDAAAGEAEEANGAETGETEGTVGIGEYEPKTIETDDGVLVIRGYSFYPQGFAGYSNTDTYDGYSIFTVHATITVKGEETKSSWSTFKTQAFQCGIDAKRHTDFSKKVLITTDLSPNVPVDIDYDFLVESTTEPITFMVKTWGHSKVVFTETITIGEDSLTPEG